MKRFLIFVTAFILMNLSCKSTRKLAHKYPDCACYYKYLDQAWQKEANGFYSIKEIHTEEDNQIVLWTQGSRFLRMWRKYKVECLMILSDKEVFRLFGKPTGTFTSYQKRYNANLTKFFYHINDEICFEKTNADGEFESCSQFQFSFCDGKQQSPCNGGGPLLLYTDSYIGNGERSQF